MKALRNLLVGFGISFIGSVPLGYLNVVGFEMYAEHGFSRLWPYLLGVVSEEAIVLYLTLVFAKKLSKGGKWVKAIEVLSIVFLLALASYFYFRNASQAAMRPAYVDYPPFLAGALLNAINFMQLPFWIGWNLFLINAKYIYVGGRLKLLYLLGALAGTFAGMLAFILSLQYLSDSVEGMSHYLMSLVIPSIFLAMALFQSYKFYQKYRAPN